jgi:hypothetical protein
VTAHALHATSEPFDPFLTHLRGAEVARDPSAIRRAMDAVRDREVVVATDRGAVLVAQIVQPFGLRFDRTAPVNPGERVAISDQRGLEYLGFRAIVGAVVETPDGPVARLFEPREVVLHPGRQQPRLAGALGADVVLETEEGLLAARAVDVSLGGLGVTIATDAGLALGRLLVAHLDFGDGTVSLPARVRSLVARDVDFRVGLQFVSWSDQLADRVQRALEGEAEPFELEVDPEDELFGEGLF